MGNAVQSVTAGAVGYSGRVHGLARQRRAAERHCAGGAIGLLLYYAIMSNGILSTRVYGILVLALAVVFGRGAIAQVDRPLAIGSVLEQRIDTSIADGVDDRVWRLRVERPTTVWVSLETADLIPDLRVERWEGGDADGVWDRIGFNEYVRFVASGDYRLVLQLDPASKRRGAFVLRVDGAAPELARGHARRVAERDYFNAALRRPDVKDSPAYELRVLEALVDVLRGLGSWRELAAVAERAATIYGRYGRFADRARLLEDRAEAEAERQRFERAVDAGEDAVAAWVRAGDLEQAAARLAWTCARSARLTTRSTRIRMMRVYRLAARAESERYALHGAATVFEEEGMVEAAMKTFARAAMLHEHAGDERSHVGATVRLVDLLVANDTATYPTFAVPESMREIVRDQLKERLFTALRDREPDVARSVATRGKTVLLESDALAEAADVALESGYVFKELRGDRSRTFARAAFEDARRLAKAAGHGGIEARALNEIGLLVSAEDPDAAVGYYAQAYLKATGSRDPEARRWAVFNLGHSFQAKNDDRKAATWYARIDSLPRRERGALGFARFLRSVIGVFERADRPGDAIRFAEHVAWAYKTHGHDRSYARAELRLGELAWKAARPAVARQAFHRAIRAAEDAESQSYRTRAAGALVLALIGFGAH